jgi:hypothetical protein
MPHFQLVTTDGDVLGTRELGCPDWPPQEHLAGPLFDPPGELLLGPAPLALPRVTDAAANGRVSAAGDVGE